MDVTIDLDFDAIKKRIEYNSHDLGEFGKMIRLEYVYNILDDVRRELEGRR